MLTSQETWQSQSRWSNLAPFLLGLQKRADFRVSVTVTVTTNTLSYFYIDPEHQALIDRIFSLSKLGLTMKSIAKTLNSEGYKSHKGKPFYSELVGALVSKYRRKARERFVRKETVLNNEQGGLN